MDIAVDGETEDFAHYMLERVGVQDMSYSPISSLTYIDKNF